MTPIYMKQSPSPFPLLEHKEDQDLQEFIPQQQATSSLSCPLFYNFFTQDQRDGDHPTKFDQHQHKVDEYSLQERSSDGDESKGSMKWIMSSNNKMRMMNSSCSTSENNKRAQKTMVNEEEEKDKYTSKVVNYYSSSAGLCANDCTVRVCADCNTTKTPLWRSGPRGPKSLCNACGIRQRKAKRAAMAAIENGTTDAPTSPKLPKKEKTPRTSHAKNLKKQKRLSFEEFNLSLISKKSGFRQVFPQDEEEAAILLMALSCGLIDHS